MNYLYLYSCKSKKVQAAYLAELSLICHTQAVKMFSSTEHVRVICLFCASVTQFSCFLKPGFSTLHMPFLQARAAPCYSETYPGPCFTVIYSFVYSISIAFQVSLLYEEAEGNVQFAHKRAGSCPSQFVLVFALSFDKS